MLKVSQATGFAEEKNLSKFDHCPMAVINPIKKMRKPYKEPESPELLLGSKQARLNVKEVTQKVLPDHLVKVPFDEMMAPLPKPREFGEQRDLSKAELEEKQQREQKRVEEQKKWEAAKKLEDLFFVTVKEKAEEQKREGTDETGLGVNPLIPKASLPKSTKAFAKFYCLSKGLTSVPEGLK